MKSAFTLSVLTIAVSLYFSESATAQPGRWIDSFVVRPFPGGMARAVPHGHWGNPFRSRPSAAPAAPKPVWKIPAGKYGLQLKNGTRIIGQPAKGWSATLKTSFGTVTIPLAQITRLEPAGNGQYSAFLKNGDRVTGVLVSKVLSFKTQFGSLMVPTPDLVRLSSATAVAKSSPAPLRRQTSKTTKRAAEAERVAIATKWAALRAALDAVLAKALAAQKEAERQRLLKLKGLRKRKKAK